MKLIVIAEDNNHPLSLIIRYIRSFLFQENFQLLIYKKREKGFDYIKELSEEGYPRFHVIMREYSNRVSCDIHVDISLHVARVQNTKILKFAKSMELYLLQKGLIIQIESWAKTRKKPKSKKSATAYKLRKKKIKEGENIE